MSVLVPWLFAGLMLWWLSRGSNDAMTVLDVLAPRYTPAEWAVIAEAESILKAAQ